MAGLTEHIRTSLKGNDSDAFERLATERNLEEVLSRLRRISALLVDAGDTVDGITGAQANALDTLICSLIIGRLTSAQVEYEPMLRLASWAGRADYHRPVELFTVNYDLLVEAGLEDLGVPYFDGFVGAIRAQFRADLVEDIGDPESATQPSGTSLPSFLVRLWKLHGSVHWISTAGDKPTVVRMGAPAPNGQPAAIYPSDAKYDESRRVPFLVLQDRFRRSLDEPETLILIIGYAFGDQHLNETIFSAARRRPRSEFVAFCYSTIPDEVARLATTTPNFQVVTRSEAILGGIRQPWATPDAVPGDVWNDDAFLLGDFEFFTRFLARSSPPRGELESQLAEVLAKAVESDA